MNIVEAKEIANKYIHCNPNADSCIEKQWDCSGCPYDFTDEEMTEAMRAFTMEKYIEEERKYGQWITKFHHDGFPDPYGECSICGFTQSISDKLNYCPNCGSKMNNKGENKNETN